MILLHDQGIQMGLNIISSWINKQTQHFLRWGERGCVWTCCWGICWSQLWPESLWNTPSTLLNLYQAVSAATVGPVCYRPLVRWPGCVEMCENNVDFRDMQWIQRLAVWISLIRNTVSLFFANTRINCSWSLLVWNLQCLRNSDDNMVLQ